MFSSNDLISFVFANEGDTYYRDDLQKLELEQHLWYLLHENFDAVYFLREEDKQLKADSFGDRQGPCPELKKGFLAPSTEKQMQKWLQEQMQRKTGRKGTAFVCRLQDFCSLLSQPQWEKTLQNIKQGQNRSGIFVVIASATAEKTTGLLLNSPVFEYLQETAVTNLRSGELREMYDTLSKQKWGSCFFLNGFTPENLRALLLHVVVEQPSRMECAEQLDKLGNTLYNLLNTPGDFPLFAFPFPSKYLTFYQLYKELQKDEVWDRLVASCQAGLCSCDEGTCVPVLREKDSCASRCLQMKLPMVLRDDGAAENLLREIRSLVSVPKNRVENPRILEKANRFQNCIGTVSADDRETYITVLRALKFCAEQMYMPPESEKLELALEIAESYETVIETSQKCYRMQQTLENTKPDGEYALAKKIQEHNLEQTRKNLHIHKTIVDGTKAAILEATQKLNNPSVVEVKEILEKYRETKERTAKDVETLPEWAESAEPEKKQEKPKTEKPAKEIPSEPGPGESALADMSYEYKKKLFNNAKPPSGL